MKSGVRFHDGVFFERYEDYRVLHLPLRRQRQMCIRGGGGFKNATYVIKKPLKGSCHPKKASRINHRRYFPEILIRFLRHIPSAVKLLQHPCVVSLPKIWSRYKHKQFFFCLCCRLAKTKLHKLFLF